MTPRQRFRETMRYGRPDRVPWLDEGLRDDVLKCWQQQGLPLDADLSALFHYDRRERIELGLGAKPKSSGLPATEADLRALRSRLDPNDPSRLPADWPERVQRWRGRGHILELPLHSGLFLTLGVNDWTSLERVLYLLADAPAIVREIMDAQAALAAAMAEHVLREVEVDFASFSEPIGTSHGPLVSPAMYRQLALDTYRPILDVLRAHGVETIVFMTYGNALVLMPDILEAGFNCLWAMETETQAMDYRRLRRRFGKALRLIGGVDLDSLLVSEAEVEREVAAKVPELLAEGGYIPLADGRVRTSVPLASYTYYRRVLERVTQGR